MRPLGNGLDHSTTGFTITDQHGRTVPGDVVKAVLDMVIRGEQPVIQNPANGYRDLNRSVAGSFTQSAISILKSSKKPIVRINVIPENAITAQQRRALVRQFKTEYKGRSRNAFLIVQGGEKGIRIHVSFHGFQQSFLQKSEDAAPFSHDTGSAYFRMMKALRDEKRLTNHVKKKIAARKRVAETAEQLTNISAASVSSQPVTKIPNPKKIPDPKICIETAWRLAEGRSNQLSVEAVWRSVESARNQEKRAAQADVAWFFAYDLKPAMRGKTPSEVTNVMSASRLAVLAAR